MMIWLTNDDFHCLYSRFEFSSECIPLHKCTNPWHEWGKKTPPTFSYYGLWCCCCVWGWATMYTIYTFDTHWMDFSLLSSQLYPHSGHQISLLEEILALQKTSHLYLRFNISTKHERHKTAVFHLSRLSLILLVFSVIRETESSLCIAWFL